MTQTQAVLVQNEDWSAAVAEAVGQLEGFGQADIVFVFASHLYRADLPELAKSLYQQLGPKHLVGCTGQAIIGQEREVEETPALAVLAIRLPGLELKASHISQSELSATMLTSKEIGLPQTNAWLVMADPFTLEAERLTNALTEMQPGLPIVGGLASGDFRARRTQLFLDDQTFSEGAITVAVAGDYTIRPVVSQGATPIGEDWMVTEAEGNIVTGISGRSAFGVLAQTFQNLSPAKQEQARRNLLVGLAVDEYKSNFGRGDFIIRGLLGFDANSGAIAIGDEPRIGQTIQFQLRDAEAADEDLRELLTMAKNDLAGQEPVAGLLFSCNGRGLDLFGTPDHDAAMVQSFFEGLPLAGFFCNGEIGPVGPKTFLHGFTASLGLFVKVSTTGNTESAE